MTELGILVAAVRKYRQMYREIMEIRDDRLRENLEHTHSKLGMFLDSSEEWKAAKQVVEIEDMNRAASRWKEE